MDELGLLRIGASIALVSSILSSVISAIVTHTLSLRYDKVRRDRDKQEREAEEESTRKKALNAEILNYVLRNPDKYREIRDKVIDEHAKKLENQE